jgi:hypothetical protein
MSQPLNIIIVETSGTLKPLSIKDFKEEELYKKCGFKKSEDFIQQVEWSAKYDGKKYYVHVFGKLNGKANSENKYDFPPPIDQKLFFGSCAIISFIKNSDGSKKYIDLSLQLWNKIYEKLFGGFEDLLTTSKEDEEEEDELDNIPKEKKTKHGYLKDGFVVDSSETEDENSIVNSDEELDETNDSESEDTKEDEISDIIIEDIGSELSQESYDYDTE